MPLISFVMPAYKGRFIREAIASILGQSYQRLELIIVDDCSPDPLKSIVEQFNDGRISYYRNDSNIGGSDLVAAWNKAMSYAKGEFSVLASDDDIYHEDFAQEMINLSLRYPNVDVFHCREAMIDEKGALYDIGAPRAEYETGVEMLYHRGVRRMLQTVPDFMFRTAALRAIGGFVSFPLAWASDDATWIRMSRDNGACCSARVLFYWRGSGINISTLKRNAIGKLRANELYRKWLHCFIETAKPKSEIDAFILTKVRKLIDITVDRESCWVMFENTLCMFLRVMFDRTLKLNPGLRKKFLRNRIATIPRRIKNLFTRAGS